MLDTSHGTTCADCGASFPLPPAGGGASGYAVTRVPRFAVARVRYLPRDGGASIVRRSCDAGPQDTACTLHRALYGVEREAEAHELNRKLPPSRAPGERVDVVSVAIDGEPAMTAERRICYACAALLETETMVATGRTCLYLCEKEDANGPHVRRIMAGTKRYRYTLENWPGTAPFRILGSVRESHGYGFGRRYDVRTLRFAGPDGFVWSARCAGDMQLTRCKRTKKRLPGAA